MRILVILLLFIACGPMQAIDKPEPNVSIEVIALNTPGITEAIISRCQAVRTVTVSNITTHYTRGRVIVTVFYPTLEPREQVLLTEVLNELKVLSVVVTESR